MTHDAKLCDQRAVIPRHANCHSDPLALSFQAPNCHSERSEESHKAVLQVPYEILHSVQNDMAGGFVQNDKAGAALRSE